MLRRLQIDWQVVLLLAPIALELLRQALGLRWGAHQRLFIYLQPDTMWTWTLAVVLLATVLGVATPIKIWNNARIEHRLQEQEKLLLAAKIEALASQINPHFLFNTLTSISSLIRTQPDTARMLITKLSGLLRRLMRSTDHFVTLREELESIDEYLDIEVIRFGPQLQVDKQISPDTLDVIVPSMILQPLVENSIKHGLSRKVGGGRITIRTSLRDGHAIIEVHDDGLGMTRGTARAGVRRRHRPEQRERAAADDLRRAAASLKLTSEPGQGTCARLEIPELIRSRARDRHDARRRSPHRSSSTTSSSRATSWATCSASSAASRSIGQAGNGVEALETIDRLQPDLVFLDVQMPGLTGFEVARRLLDEGPASHIIFVTAYDQHAIEAFEVNAVDYLLKPVDPARLEMALQRARRRISADRRAGDDERRQSDAATGAA